MIKDPGELSEKVQILAPTVSYGSNGEPLNTWGEYATRWCKVETLGGSETTQADILMPAARAKFTVRYDANLTENHRLVWNAQTWNVVSITFEGRKNYIVIIAESNTSQTGDSTSYGNYYLTNSLKIRVVTGAIKAGATPTQAEVNTAVGLTAVQAGSGYTIYIEFPVGSYYYLFISNGTDWRRVLFAGF